MEFSESHEKIKGSYFNQISNVMLAKNIFNHF
jgi:hypothetical protein